MGVPHAGQRDAGKATLSPRGSRWMTTFRKLPSTRPSETAMLAQNQKGSSASTGRMLGYDSFGHGHGKIDDAFSRALLGGRPRVDRIRTGAGGRPRARRGDTAALAF